MKLVSAAGESQLFKLKRSVSISWFCEHLPPKTVIKSKPRTAAKRFVKNIETKIHISFKMTESSLSTTTLPINQASHDDSNKNDKRSHESLNGWTIEALIDNTSKANASQSRRSSFESSILHEDDDISDEDQRDFRDYNIDTVLLAWDQISELSHEITSSLMAKQASVLCELFRHKTAALKFETATKKRRLEEAPFPSQEPNESSSTVVVISDEETTSVHEGLPDDLSSQVDRIGRMSKLVMEIEYCQQELRREMLAMNDDF